MFDTSKLAIPMSLNQVKAAAESIEIARFSLDEAVKEHAELWDSWKFLEQKAQVTLSLAGIFKAGVFTIAASEHELLSNKAVATILLMLSLLLLLSILAAISSIRARSIPTPHRGMEGFKECEKLIKRSGNYPGDQTLYENLVRDTARRWSSVNDRMSANLTKKSELLKLSVNILIFAGCTAVFLLLTILFSANKV